MISTDFEPDWISAPGATLLDAIEERGLSVQELAHLLGYSHVRVERLLLGKEAITRDVSKLLAERIGGSEQFWIARETIYRNEVARLQTKGSEKAAVAWLAELPVRDMQRFGWITSTRESNRNVTSCLTFFDVANAKQWREKYAKVLAAVSFRTSPTYKSEPGAVLAWLRFGEIRSDAIECRRWNAKGFEQALGSIRRLTRIKTPAQFVPELQRLCAEHGVAVVIAPAPEGCRASGATQFLASNKAMMLLSFRYRSDDQFWFTFFHEAAHLLLHQDKPFFLEDGSEVSQKEEHEANLYAQNVLIPAQVRAEMLDSQPTKSEIMRFAVKAGVSRGIIVGQLQHHGKLRSDQFNWMKRHYKIDDLKKLV